jgi:hypothetical protein
MDRMERSLNIKAVAEATLVSEEAASEVEEKVVEKPVAKKKTSAKKKSS